MAPKGPYKLCTVNTAPERAKRLVGRVVEDVKEEYTIQHVENAESMFSGVTCCYLTTCFRALDLDLDLDLRVAGNMTSYSKLMS